MDEPEHVDNILTFLSGYDTLEYSWVKAIAVSVRLRILFVTLQSTNNSFGILNFATKQGHSRGTRTGPKLLTFEQAKHLGAKGPKARVSAGQLGGRADLSKEKDQRSLTDA